MSSMRLLLFLSGCLVAGPALGTSQGTKPANPIPEAGPETLPLCSGARIFDCFQLDNACRPMRLVIGLPDADESARKLGRRLRKTVEGQLQTWGLLTHSPLDSVSAILDVRLRRHGPEFVVRMRFNKRLDDRLTGQRHFAATWETWDRIEAVTPGDDPGRIVQHLSLGVGHFLLECVRVNETDCLIRRQRDPPPPRESSRSERVSVNGHP